MLILIAIAAGLALASLGGGLYEFIVVDPFWPNRLDLVQPARGGIDRKRFWIPVHTAFELALIALLIWTWGGGSVFRALLLAFGSHAIMRIWSAFDFIPKSLRFERAEPAAFDPVAARRWTRRSLGRLPLDLITCGAMLAAVVAVARLP